MHENLKIYMATVITDKDLDTMVQAEIIIAAHNFKEAEALLGDNQILTRMVVMTNWVLADSRESYAGEYYMVDTIYNSEATGEEDSIIYLIRANNFTEIEDIVREEAQESFAFIQATEAIPHEVLS